MIKTFRICFIVPFISLVVNKIQYIALDARRGCQSFWSRTYSTMTETLAPSNAVDEVIFWILSVWREIVVVD